MLTTPLHETAEPVSSKHSHPDAVLHREDMHNRIELALSVLSPELRAAIITVTIDETPINEATEILNCNKATLYWRIHKARKLMREALGTRH